MCMHAMPPSMLILCATPTLYAMPTFYRPPHPIMPLPPNPLILLATPSSFYMPHPSLLCFLSSFFMPHPSTPLQIAQPVPAFGGPPTADPAFQPLQGGPLPGLPFLFSRCCSFHYHHLRSALQRLRCLPHVGAVADPVPALPASPAGRQDHHLPTPGGDPQTPGRLRETHGCAGEADG